MRKTYTKRASPALDATIATIVLGAVFHLTSSFIFAVHAHNLAYISPINLLGLNTIFPGLIHSTTATVLLWAMLISIGVIFLALQRNIRIGLVIMGKRRKSSLAKQSQINSAATAVSEAGQAAGQYAQ